MIPLTVGGPRGAELDGVEDGGHVVLRCSNCGAGLLDVFVTSPREGGLVWKMRANCPFCEEAGLSCGGSYVTEVLGGFHVGGYARVKEDDASDDRPSTNHVGEELDGDTWVFSVEKVGAAIYD
jgi:hypothetical protein